MAKSIVNDLKTAVGEKEEKLAKDLDGKITKDVLEKGKGILEQYKKYIESLEEELLIDDFDFRKIKELEKLKFEDLEKATDAVSGKQPIYKPVENWVPNKKRHWWTPWRPKKIKEVRTEKVGEVIYVKKDDLVKEIGLIRVNTNKNIDLIVEDAENFINHFKEYFKKQLKRFNTTIDSVIKELSEISEKASNEETIKGLHENQLNELNDYMEKVNKVIEL